MISRVVSLIRPNLKGISYVQGFIWELKFTQINECFTFSNYWLNNLENINFLLDDNLFAKIEGCGWYQKRVCLKNTQNKITFCSF